MTFERCNTSQDTIAIKIKDNINVLSECLVVFLNTKFGMSQMRRYFTGNIQMHLNLTESKQILIPKFSVNFQNQIADMFNQSLIKQTQSKQLYKEAEQLLLGELGLVNYKPKHTLTFEASKKEIENAHRFDSEYFQPKYEEIINKIENYEGGFDLIENIVFWQKGIEVGTLAYTEKGKDFIRISDFSSFGIEESNIKISESYFSELKEKYQPIIGDILFTKDGTIGISYVVKEEVKGVISSAFLKISLKPDYYLFQTECLSLIFNSIICKMQVDQLSGGAVIAHLKPSDFEKFKIPLIKQQIQNQISEKILESHKLRKESKELLEKAKRKVENEIEKS